LKFNLNFLEKIDFDIVIVLVLIWSGILIITAPDAANLTFEVTKDALLAYFGYTTKKW
jgi:hypothetical protein